MSLVSSLREWWRWRMHRAQIHLPGIAQYRVSGTVVRLEGVRWVIEDEDSRIRHVEATDPSAVGLKVGERVEIEPALQLQATNRFASWIILRKLGAVKLDHYRIARNP